MHFGLFDSGIGGLTVLRRVVNVFPGCRYTYVGDSARAPYGGRSSEELWEINRSIIEFLIDQGVDHLIMACNTSCSQFLDRIREDYRLPVTGIVTSVSELMDGSFKRVVVLATQATVNTHAYQQVFLSQNPSVEVIEMACPSLVPIIERGEFREDDIAEVTRVLNEALAFQPSHVVMGCTHYPFLESVWRDLCPASVGLVDPADGVVNSLNRLGIFCGDSRGDIRYFVSGNEARYRAVIEEDFVLSTFGDCCEIPQMCNFRHA